MEESNSVASENAGLSSESRDEDEPSASEEEQ